MNEDDQALTNTESQSVSPAPSEEIEVPQAESPEVAEPASEVTEEPKAEVGSNKSAQHRITELNTKAKVQEETIKSLEEQLAELTGSVDHQGQQPQYQPQIHPGQEISPEQYQNDVAARADAIVNLRLQQERVLQKIQSEAAESVRTHPELNPDSEKFDKDLSEAVSQATLAYARTNPTGSVKKFVDGMMKPYKKSLEREAGQAEVDIAKEQSKAALRPQASVSSEKKASDMTTEELEKKLGMVIS